jgi:hypothetical protein
MASSELPARERKERSVDFGFMGLSLLEFGFRFSGKKGESG